MDIDRIAHLARLCLSEEEKAEFAPQLDRIVHFVEQLGELDLEGIEPTAYAVPRSNALRDDVIVASLPRDRVLANAPVVVGDSIKMPKVVE